MSFSSAILPVLFALATVSIVSGAAKVAPQKAVSPAPNVEAIAGLLSKEPTSFGARIGDRSVWESYANTSEAKSILAQAQKLLVTPLPEDADAVYMALHKDYSPPVRSRWDQHCRARRDRVRVFAEAECIENKGRYLPELERTIFSLCAERAWVFPNYDRNLESYQQKTISIDLFSSAMAWNLASADWLLGERLSPEVRRRLREEIQRRIFAPFRKMVAKQQPPYWFNYKNNWNAVCLAGVTGAALALLESPSERAFFVREAMDRSWTFLNSYTTDGYCSEGVGYWSYGFGHYVLLSEIIRRATGGKIDMLDRAPVQAGAAYGARIEIAPGLCPSFADCDPSAKPDAALLSFLNRRLGFGLQLPASGERHSRHLFSDLFYGFDANGCAANPRAFPPLQIGLRTWFDQAGIYIGRPAPGSSCRVAVALKGGHNAEQHNHNDIGSYVVLVGGRPVVLDPGQEVRSGRTFSSKRYEGNLLNSFGHPVPRVAGALQRTGAEARAVTLWTDFRDDRDVYAMDIASAYDVPALKSLARTFIFDRSGIGVLSIEDSVAFATPQTFETALITLGSWKQLEPGVIEIVYEGEAITAVVDTHGVPFSVEAAPVEGPRRGLPATTRLAVRLQRPVLTATVKVSLVPKQGNPIASPSGSPANP